jgi:hypothetical protein
MSAPHTWAPAARTIATSGGGSSRADDLSDGTDLTSGGRINRVNAFDGLFLRAEHLTRMQDYARELVSALGTAGGPGVVWGYGLSVEGNTLHVAPGLAVDAAGHPLRADQEMLLELKDVELRGDQYAVIWVARKTWPFGQEPVQGVLCEDPCSGGGSGRPYQADGVVVGKTEKTDGGLVGGSSERRRNYLANRLFAAERAEADAWPERGGDGVLDRWWGALPVPASLPGEVPVGVLFAGDEGWVIDTWSARRDRDAPPPTPAWQWRLGMRPWHVFVAQVLQFEDQLGGLFGKGSPASRASATDGLIGMIESIKGRVMGSLKSHTEQRLEELVHEFKVGELGERFAGAGLVPLARLGIEELPPAGFLPRFDAATAEGAGDAVHELLGGASDVRVCTGRMGDVGAFIARAQHRERISLENKGKDAVVDVLWVDDADSDWIAFARREEIDCGAVETEPEPETEPVLVYVIDQEPDRELYDMWQEYLEQFREDHEVRVEQHPKLPGKATVLNYPIRTWALPEEPEYSDLVKQIRDYDETKKRDVVLVAIVTEDVRRQLGVGRAGLLGLNSGEARLRAHDSFSTLGPVEAIVVLVGFGGGR